MDRPVTPLGDRFTSQETERRYAMLMEAMAEQALDAVLLIHHGTARPSDNLQSYFLQWDYIFGTVAVLVNAQGARVAFSSELQAYQIGAYSTISDSRIIKEPWEGGDYVAAVVEQLRAWGLDAGRVGCELESLPSRWFRRLGDLLPGVELVDASAALCALWLSRSQEELEAIEEAARLADSGFGHILSVTRPDMTEVDVVSEFNNHTARNGANRNFTLITSGRLTGFSDHTFGELGLPTRRTLKAGDTVLLEMSPAVKGYWAQLVRAYTLGTSSETAIGLHRACVAALAATSPTLRPGTTLGEAASVLWEAAEAAGYVPRYPCGHVIGPDLAMERMLKTSARRLNEGDTIVVHPRLRTGDGQASLFWGETYKVTGSGGVALTSTGTTLYEIS